MTGAISHEDGHANLAATYVNNAYTAVAAEITKINGHVDLARAAWDSDAARKFKAAADQMVAGAEQVQRKMDEVSAILNRIGSDLVAANVEGEGDIDKLAGNVDYKINF